MRNEPLQIRYLQLLLVFLISFAVFRTIWLHSKLVDSDDTTKSSSVYLPTPWQWMANSQETALQKEMAQTLQCHKLGRRRHAQSPPTARALFCQIAAEQGYLFGGSSSSSSTVSQRDVLLAIFQWAERVIPDAETLRNLLQQGVPLHTTLLGRPVELWAPARDQGLRQALQAIHERNDNDENEDSNGYLPLSNWNLGPDKLMVHVGSHLGVTTLAAWQRFPGTRIVSLEAAAPNWLYQLLNLARNLPPAWWGRVTVLPTAVAETDNVTLHFAWQPYATANCQAWPSTDEAFSRTVTGNMWFTATARNLDSVLSQQQLPAVPEKDEKSGNNGDRAVAASIDLLVIDCQGCEYNVMPTLRARVQQAVGTIHWGYIPRPAKPSSHRAQATHRLLCQYDDFVQRAKECCEFQNDKKNDASTDHHNAIADSSSLELCRDFQSWAATHDLWNVPQDTAGWKQQLPLDALVVESPELANPDLWPKQLDVMEEDLTEEEIRVIGGDDVL